MTKDRLAELLIKTGMLNKENLERAVNAQKIHGGDLGRTMVDMGLISEETLVRAYATLYSMQAVTLTPQKLEADVAKMLPKAVCEKWGVIAFRVDQGKKYLDVAQADPTNLDATDEIRRATKYTVRFFLATRSSIGNSINFAFYSDNLANVGVGSEVAFSFGSDSGGMQVDHSGPSMGGFTQGQGESYPGGQEAIPLQGAGDMASFQPVDQQDGVSFSGQTAQGPMPMTSPFHQRQPAPGAAPTPTPAPEPAREPPTPMAPKPPPRDELLDEKLGRSGNLAGEDDGPREIQIDLSGSGSVAVAQPQPPPMPTENTTTGWPDQRQAPPSAPSPELVAKLEHLTGAMESLEAAITVNRTVLENLLRRLIQKGLLTRDEAMMVVKVEE